ncbi:MAG: hypothetical protein HY721_09435 [Planctomycetes bacterium]|nr:hypothetical protein [Planctomycetota bacterium]
MSFRKILSLAIFLLAACLGAWWAYRALAPEETKIRWLVESMAEGFNRSRPSRTIEGLAEDFREDTAKASKPEVHQFLAYLFLKERDEKTKDFLWKVELEEVEVSVLSEEEPRKAELGLTAAFSRRAGGSWSPVWKARIDAELEEREEGWRVVRARHEALEGRRPF